jgi:hypothetical protein
MSDAPDDQVEDEPSARADAAADPDAPADAPAAGEPGDGSDDADLDALRAEVEEKYDFENFGPQDMAEMSAEEWEAAFDADTWITGEELLDRVEADLKRRVADRDVFARVERFDDLLVAYSDSGYAAVYPDGSVEGRGTVLRDVKPTVALCSMDSYDVPAMPDEEVLPEPQEVPESSDALGNTVLQIVAGVQVLAGLVLIGAWVLSLFGFSPPGTSTRGLNLPLLVVAGLGLLLIGIFLFVVVANARLSDKFRAEEFRNRLRAIGMEDGERPEFLAEIEGIEGELPESLREAGEEPESEPVGEEPDSEASAGEEPDSEASAGEEPDSEASAGEEPDRETSAGEKPGAD